MTATTIRVQMAQRKDTAANWTAANPILLSGEIGYETDTKKFKIGNGSTNWNSLAYLPIPDGSGNLTITGNLEIGSTGSLTFEGSTADGFETTLAVTNPTADRTITLPDRSGTVITSGDTGTVTSTMILDGTIVNDDVNASAAIAGTKITPNFGAQTITTTGVVSAAVGAAATPSITFTGDTNTGIYSPGADQVAISTGGSGSLFVDASGNVILGTTSILSGASGRVLQIGTTTDTASTLQFGATTTGNSYIQFGDGGSPESYAGYLQYTHTDNALLFGTNKQERLRITSTGTVNIVGAGTGGVTQAVSFNGSAPVDSLVLTSGGLVGVGTSLPVDKLHVDGRIAVSTDSSTPTTGEAFFYKSASGAVMSGFGATIETGGAGSRQARVSVDSSGRVGIGTTAPSYALDVRTTGTSISSSFTSDQSEQYIALKDSGTTIGHVRLGSTSGSMLFFAGNGERGRFDSSGRLLVGTSSQSGGALLQVNGDRVRIATAKTPASATDTGTAGEICWDASYVYVCTATNTWKRSALSTW